MKTEYVKTRFESLVSKRAVRLEKLSKKARNQSNGDDFVTGAGDDSEKEDSEDEVKKGLDNEDKGHFETSQSLLNAYLAQVRAFGESAADESAGEGSSVFTQQSAEGGTKRSKSGPSGQSNENEDDALIERSANGAAKPSKLSKLPRVSHADLCQSQALDHSSRTSGGFEALAVSQKPDTPEQFNAKISSGVNAISSAISSTIAGAIHAWAEMKKSDRACLRLDGHEFAAIDGTAPPIILCKHCGLRV